MAEACVAMMLKAMVQNRSPSPRRYESAVWTWRVFQIPHETMAATVASSTVQSSALTPAPTRAAGGPRSRRPAPAAPGPTAARASDRAHPRRQRGAGRGSLLFGDQIREQPEGARHARGELAEERQPGIDESALAVSPDDHRAAQRRL